MLHSNGEEVRTATLPEIARDWGRDCVELRFQKWEEQWHATAILPGDSQLRFEVVGRSDAEMLQDALEAAQLISETGQPFADAIFADGDSCEASSQWMEFARTRELKEIYIYRS